MTAMTMQDFDVMVNCKWMLEKCAMVGNKRTFPENVQEV